MSFPRYRRDGRTHAAPPDVREVLLIKRTGDEERKQRMTKRPDDEKRKQRMTKRPGDETRKQRMTLTRSGVHRSLSIASHVVFRVFETSCAESSSTAVFLPLSGLPTAKRSSYR